MTEYICNLAKGVCPHCCRLVTDVEKETDEEAAMGLHTEFTATAINCYRKYYYTNSPYWMPEEDWKRCKEEKQ